MPNERLRALLLERGETPDKLPEAVHVDPKTVERWVTKGRIPYRAHRYAVAAFFGVDESYIWPDALSRDHVAMVSESEIVAVYPHRAEVPRDVWEHLFSQAAREIGVLVYAGLFLSEDARVQRGRRARDGKSSPKRGMKRGPNLTAEERSRRGNPLRLRARRHDLCGIGPGGTDLASDASTAAAEDAPRPSLARRCARPLSRRQLRRTGLDSACYLVPVTPAARPLPR
jgi:transcriptional regulator with XRE-family HTH domain